MTNVLIFGVTPEMIHHWGWFLAFGIVLLALGIAAIVRSQSQRLWLRCYSSAGC